MNISHQMLYIPDMYKIKYIIFKQTLLYITIDKDLFILLWISYSSYETNVNILAVIDVCDKLKVSYICKKDILFFYCRYI